MRKLLEHGFKGLYYFLTSKTYRIFFRLLLQLGGKNRYNPVKIRALGYRLALPDGPSFLWQFYEIFFKENYKFKSDKSKPLIYDCGANVGTSCLYFKKQFPEAIIHAFEPDPEIFSYLEKNLAANGIEDVQLHRVAVWKKKEILQFQTEGADSGKVSPGSASTVEVQAIRLKEWIEKEEETIDFLKLDIEGAEVEVVQDCAEILPKVRHLFVEYHSYNEQPQHLGCILEILTERGFRYYLENESLRKQPFIQKKGKTGMDMQINIFAYREKGDP